MEDLNYYNDKKNTGNSNQLIEDSTQNHSDTTTVGEPDQTSRGNGNLSPLLRELNQKTSLLRKELKIKGQIGEAHQRDKWTYVSLIQRLLQFLESYFEEKSATDSCGTLTSMIQLPEES